MTKYLEEVCLNYRPVVVLNDDKEKNELQNKH